MKVREYSKRELIELSKNHNALVKGTYCIEEGGDTMLSMINAHVSKNGSIDPCMIIPSNQTKSGGSEEFIFDQDRVEKFVLSI